VWGRHVWGGHVWGGHSCPPPLTLLLILAYVNTLPAAVWTSPGTNPFVP
jgi:hypothetical protein